MTAQELAVLIGPIVEEEHAIGIEDLCQLCAVERSFIVELVQQGALEGELVDAPHFTGLAVRRVRIAARLHRDLGVNAAGSALVLELLERIEALEGRLRNPRPP